MAQSTKGKQTTTRTTTGRRTGTRAARPARGGLAQTVTPDSTLAAVIGAEQATRAEITKRMWNYIRDRNLQDPADRRMIRADAKLRNVFGGKERVSMFEMTRLVNQHVK